jgi:hypothetical protein
MVALKFKDGSIEWNGMKYPDEESLYEAADIIYGRNPSNPLVILEKCGVERMRNRDMGPHD